MGGTETIIAAAARQFCERHKVRDAPSTFGKKGLQLHMYICTFHEADTWRERRHVCGVQAKTRRQSRHQFRSSLITTSTYVGDHDSGDRTEKDSVTAHESQEARRTVQQ